MLQIGELIDHVVANDGNPPPPNRHGYQYVMAGNGVFIRAENAFVDVLQPIAPAVVRGLPSLRPFIHLKHSRLPAAFLVTILRHAGQHLDQEVVYQVVATDGHFRVKAVAYGGKTSVQFEDAAPSTRILMGAHSHNTMEAYFSKTDDRYEQEFRWFLVMGKLDKRRPQVSLRIGVYGYFFPMPIKTLFDAGDMTDVWEDVCKR